MKRTIESALFLAGRHIGLKELSTITGIDNPAEVKQAIEDLKREYQRRSSPIEIIEEQGKYKMDLKPEHLDKVKELAPQMDMNRAILQTLSFIAYKQPIKQSKIVKKFGNRIYDYVHELVDRGLIIAERAGHTKMLRTSPKLLAYLGEADITKLKDSIKVKRAELDAEEFEKTQLKAREQELKVKRRRKPKGTKVEIKREVEFDEWVDKAHKDEQDQELNVMEEFEKGVDDKEADEDFFENKGKKREEE